MGRKKFWNKVLDVGWAAVLLMPIICVVLALFRNGYVFADIHSINWAVVFEGYTWVSALPSFNATLNLFKQAGFVSVGNISYVFFCFGFNALFMSAMRFVFKVMIALFLFCDKAIDKLTGDNLR